MMKHILKKYKTIKRSYVLNLTQIDIIRRRDEYNMLDKTITDCFEAYTTFTTNLYFDYTNKKHVFADKTCKKNFQTIFHVLMIIIVKFAQ